MSDQSEREEVFSTIERQGDEVFLKLKVNGKLCEAKITPEWNTQHEQQKLYNWLLDTVPEADRA